MIKAIELRKGRTIVYEGTLYVVHDVTNVQKGNKGSYMQAKLKGLIKGGILDVRFNVHERLETPFLEDKEHEYLYRDGAHFVFMDTTTYDQINVTEDLVGEAVAFLKPNERVKCQIYQGNVVRVEMPIVVELEITETPPVVKGATATNQPKDAIVETGAKIRVPGFIAPGEKIRVDTRTGEYLERAK